MADLWLGKDIVVVRGMVSLLSLCIVVFWGDKRLKVNRGKKLKYLAPFFIVLSLTVCIIFELGTVD
jgi:hypothetical protein